MVNKRIDLYIGLGNKKTGKIEDKEAIKKRVADYFERKKVKYFFTEQIGGYVYNKGRYIVEDSLKLTIIEDYSEVDIEELVYVVKTDYSQEAILVDIKEMDVSYE